MYFQNYELLNYIKTINLVRTYHLFIRLDCSLYTIDWGPLKYWPTDYPNNKIFTTIFVLFYHLRCRIKIDCFRSSDTLDQLQPAHFNYNGVSPLCKVAFLTFFIRCFPSLLTPLSPLDSLRASISKHDTKDRGIPTSSSTSRSITRSFSSYINQSFSRSVTLTLPGIRWL